jgi:hypothetical protein
MTAATYGGESSIWDCAAGPANCSTVRGFSNMELIATVYSVQKATFSNSPVDYVYDSVTIPLIH